MRKTPLEFAIIILDTLVAFVAGKKAIRQTVCFAVFNNALTALAVVGTTFLGTGALFDIRTTHRHSSIYDFQNPAAKAFSVRSPGGG